MPLITTVGIPTFLRDGVLVATIREVLKQSPSADQIIVVDQTPEHDTATTEFLREAQEKGLLRYFFQLEPSLTKARNQILKQAMGDIVIFIDDDVELPEGFIAAHLRHYADPEIHLVTGAVLRRDQIAEYVKKVERDSSCRPADPKDDVRGCNHSVRLGAAISVGGYDEHFLGGAQGEENDFARRLKAAGGRQVVDPEAWVHHLKAPTGGCRIASNPSWAEWKKTASIWLFGFRHDWPSSLSFILDAFRSGPRRKENVLRPWRQPMAIASYLYAACWAYRRSRLVKSPFGVETQAQPPVAEHA